MGKDGSQAASSPLVLAWRQAEEARAREGSARRRLTDARRRRAFWERLHTQLAACHPAAALLLLRQEAAHGEVDAGNLPDGAVLEQLQVAVEQQARAQVAPIARAFPAALQAAGLAIDPASRHPQYSVRDGFLRVTMDADALTATVAPRDGAAIVVGLDLAPLVETVRREATRLFERPLDRDAFLRMLFDAYDALCREEERPPGDSVPLRRVVAHLGNAQRPFAADEFNVDLARLVQTGDTMHGGRRLKLQQTRNARQGMLLHGLEQGGYAGFLSVVREDEPC